MRPHAPPASSSTPVHPPHTTIKLIVICTASDRLHHGASNPPRLSLISLPKLLRFGSPYTAAPGPTPNPPGHPSRAVTAAAVTNVSSSTWGTVDQTLTLGPQSACPYIQILSNMKVQDCIFLLKSMPSRIMIWLRRSWFRLTFCLVMFDDTNHLLFCSQDANIRFKICMFPPGHSCVVPARLFFCYRDPMLHIHPIHACTCRWIDNTTMLLRHMHPAPKCASLLSARCLVMKMSVL